MTGSAWRTMTTEPGPLWQHAGQNQTFDRAVQFLHHTTSMASANSTWRKHPFEVDQSYVALESFHDPLGSEFVAGRRYELRHVGYSRYDSSTVFTFQSQENDEPRQWWWHDDEPDGLCAQRFSKPG